MRRSVVLAIVLVLAAAACTQDTAVDGTPETSTTMTVAPTTTTTATTTTTPTATTTVTPTTTTAPYVWPWADVAHAYTYQSVGYSCGPDPTKGCEGDADMALDEVWLHKELDSATADCLDILIADQGNSARSHAGDQNLEGTGWGLRIVQLDAPPNGISIGGNAWLELTVSSVSAADYAERATALPERSKDMPTKLLGPTDIDRASITAPPEATNVVEEMVLISTTDDMMQWIIALTDDQVYHHYATYWGLHGQTVLTVKLNGGETT